MVATKPTMQQVSILGGIIKFFCDALPFLKYVQGTTGTVSANPINTFVELKNNSGSVLGAMANPTQIYGMENITTTTTNSTLSVLQLGYDDNGAGLNFVSLYDFFPNIGNTAVNINNIIGGGSVPTGKHIVWKIQSSGNESLTIAYKLFYLQTT